MATEIGSAFARFTLDIQGLKEGLKQAKSLLQQYQKDLEATMVVKIRIDVPSVINMPRLSNPAQQAIGKAAQQASGGTGPATASAGVTPPGGAVSPGVATLGADAANAATAIDSLAKNELRALINARDFGSALVKLDELLKTYAGNVEIVTQLKAAQATVERQYNSQLTRQTVFIAESAAANGNYGDGLSKLAARLQDTIKNSDEWIQLVKSARGILASETKEINANTDALIDNEKKRGHFNAALGLNQAAQGATTDPGRKRALESEEIDILAKIAAETKALANEQIQGAIAAKDYFGAVTLINTELGSGQATIQREIALRELLTKITRAETQARYDELDAITANKKLQGDTIGAFRSNIQATGEAQRAPVTDDARLAALERERLKLGQQLTQEQRAEADASVRAATAQREYWKALSEVQIQLQLVDEGSQRFSQLKAEEASLIRKIAGAMDSEAVATARLQQSQSQHAAAVQTLRDAMVGLSAGSERQIALQQELTNVELRARAVSEGIADTITAQMVAQKHYSDALLYNASKQAQTPAGAAGAPRRADLELERIQITNAQAAADANLAQSNIKLQRQLDEYAKVIALITKEQLKYKTVTSEWLNLERQKQAIIEQAENETRKDADAAIKAARATKDYSEAVRILGIEQKRAQGLGDNRRLNQLTTIGAGINADQGPGLFAQIASGAQKILGPLAAGYIAFTAFRVARDQLTEGSRVAAELELERRSIGAMVEGVQTGNKVFDQAIAFGQKYAKTQEDMGKAADEAGIVLRTTTSDAAKVFEVLARLQSRAPGKDFGDAVRSITELQAGQLQSIERVFNVPRRFAQELSAAIQQGVDPIQAVDAVLTKLGQTTDVLDVQLTGPQKQFKDLAVQTEAVRISVGKMVNSFAGPISEGLAKVLSGYVAIQDAIQKTTELEAARREADRLNKGGAPSAVQTGQAQAGPALLPGIKPSPGGGLLDKAIVASTNYLLGFYNTWKLIENVGPQAAQDLAKGFDTSGVSIKALRDIALGAAPALKGLLAGTQADTKPPPVIDQLSRMTALINQANEGTITFDKLAESTRKLTGIKFGDDFLGVIQHINNTTPDVTQRLDLMQQALINVHKVMDAQVNPQLAARYIPEIVAIENQLKVLEGQSPIDITIAMHVEQMTAATTAIDAITKQVQQAQQSIDKSNAAIKKSNDDFGRQQHYADIDHNHQVTQARDDFNRGRARSDIDWATQRANQQRDFDLQDSRANEDHARDKAQKQKQRQNDEARAERDFLYTMQKNRRDFDIQNNRNTEDFELDRRKLLAEGRIKEAQLLTERFGIQQRRAGEDFGRGQSDAGDAFAQQRADRKHDQEEQDKLDDANFARERARRLADYQTQRDDAQTAHDIQNQRASDDFERTQKQQNDAYTEQRRRAGEAHTAQIDDMKAQQQETLDTLNKYLADQKEALEQAKRDQLEILALQARGFTEEEAKAIVALQTAQREFDKEMLAFNATASDGGIKTALSFIENFAKTLLAGVKPAVDNPLQNYGDYLKGKSPPPKGPLHDIDVGARNAAKAWTDAFGVTIGDTTMLNKGLARQSDALRTNPGATLRNSVVRTTPHDMMHWDDRIAFTTPSRHITVTVPIGLAMDGQAVGKLVTPHVADQLIDDLQVSVNVVDASQKIALTQTSFRGGPSVTRAGG